ncbi:Protein FAM32A [Amphibalanus amphitrite]|uniref:Protein FAM32A n=1 Tax=Amphibalanus amphitrite TaxID=1232801 RepID=A0A6A4VRS7_AMPAM|nr:protein FAM32A-like [Amphibalanus amphitrite]KAF0292768.1 Protein FAM32A [Amphibalanus amphitrite]
MSEYQMLGKSGLKLKGVADVSLKKKKKKKDKTKILETVVKAPVDASTEVSKKQQKTKTKAELAFEKQREKNELKRIMEKASKTHKQRVEDFNRHLDSLTEHFDIPKVSWTK